MAKWMKGFGWKAWALFGVVLVCGALCASRLFAGTPTLADRIDSLASSDPATRAEAAAAIEEGGSSNLSSVLSAIDSDRSPIAKANLARLAAKIGVGTGQASTLKDLLAARNPATRHAGIVVLASNPAIAVDALTKTASNVLEMAPNRAAAAEALGGVSSGRSALKKIVQDARTPETVRLAALRGLARTNSDGAADVKAFALDTKRRLRERKAAVWALAQEGSDAHDLLVDLTGASEPWLRAHAVAALSKRGGSDAKTYDGLLADEAAEVRVEALRALLMTSSASDYESDIAAGLDDADVRVVIAAAEWLGANDSAHADDLKPKLSGLLDSTSFPARCAAALALHALGDDSGADTMAADANGEDAGQKLRAQEIHDLITAAK